MEENNGFSRGIVTGILITMVIFLAATGLFLANGVITVGKGETTKVENYDSASNSDTKNEFLTKVNKKITTIMSLMDNYYLDDYEEDEMIDGLLYGMLASVGDPYTGYYNEESYSSLMESSEGVYYGIGVVVSQNPETQEVYVVNPYDDCPGAEAGMLPGDIIFSIEDTPVTGMDLNEVVAMIRGAEGTTVEIAVVHANATEESVLTVERRKIEVQTVEYEVLENNIGYIQITQFDEITTEQFKTGMDALIQQGIEGLIVDLRDNPGGSLETVLEILDMVLPKGIYTYLVDKNDKRENYKGTHDADYDYPMVVLVNENSASASELFTGAVKDFDKATIVGTTTFGKGIVQQVFSLMDGTGIKVTMAKYYTPSGVCIHETGITPDVEIDLDEGEYASTVTFEEDEQLKEGIKTLTEQMFAQ